MDTLDPNHPQSPRLTEVPVRESHFRSSDPLDLINAVVEAYNALMGYGAFTRHEVPGEVVHSYHLDYYIAQVNNGGHEQFASNSGWAEDIRRDVEAGLSGVGAGDHLALFREVVSYIDADPWRKAAILARGGFDHPTHGPVDPWIQHKDSEFFRISERAEIAPRHARWLRSLTCIKPVPDLQWKYEMARALDSNPLRDARLVQRGGERRDFVADLIANAPLKKTYFEYASELAARLGIELPLLPEQHWQETRDDGGEVSFNVFSTDRGRILVVFADLDVRIYGMKRSWWGRSKFAGPAIAEARMERQEV